MSFQSLGLHPKLRSALHKKAYNTPTPIQTAAIPLVMNKHDIMAGAQTGTGKTAAFALPLLHDLITNADNHPLPGIKVLVLTPTRELAQQVHSSFVEYSTGSSIQCVAAYGGASINPQIEKLSAGCDVLVATPGRLLELLFKQLIHLDDVKAWVLDEADRMLDMGFMPDIKRILPYLPQNKQTLLFSATLNKEITGFSNLFMTKAKLVEVDNRNASADKVEQTIYQVDKAQKSAALSYLIGSRNWHQVLVFTRTKIGADELAKEMKKDGITAQSIHGNKSQGARERALADFKERKIRALVATDVAARGIDIEQLEYVVNHELPYNAEDYIHRVGRTGRAGAAGLAVSLVASKEQYLLKDIEKLLGINFMPQWLEGFEPSQDAIEQEQNKRKPSKKSLRNKVLSGKDNRKPRRRR